MQITDTIADLLTRIRNANAAKHDSVEIPASNLKKSICQILADEGYIKGFNVIEDGKQGIIKVTLRRIQARPAYLQQCRRHAEGNEGTRRRDHLHLQGCYD